MPRAAPRGLDQGRRVPPRQDRRAGDGAARGELVARPDRGADPNPSYRDRATGAGPLDDAPRVREPRERPLAQRDHAQVHDLDAPIAPRMAEPRAVLDEKCVPDPLGIVAWYGHRHFVALSGEPAIGVAPDVAVGHLAPPFCQPRRAGVAGHSG